jgi:uncharacterized membrane protein YdjX (TVP38/TMEM64 family)
MEKRSLTKLLLGTLLIVVVFFILRSVFPQGISVDGIQAYVASAGAFGPIVLGLMYIVAVVAVLPASPFSLLSGALFGPVLGTIVVIVSASIGATIAFFIARYVGRSFVDQFISRYGEKLKTYDKKLEDRGFMTVLVLRLLPIFPFNVLNYILGVTKVRPTHYILATLIGIIPGAFAFVYAGATATNPSIQNIVIAGLILILLLSIGPLYRKFSHHE